MSYLVLARKYRPQTFEDVVGQKSVVKTLQNSLARQRVAHALLFSGVRGVGKTTLARIMAKAINCESETENRPCNECRSCVDITSGQSLDLHEIDGASNRGIQEIRELKEKIRFLPTTSQFKIIIIDEVHMLTTEAFNALLKTLEEPPKHVHFMFATTEIHKIPITILSRCQRYELKRITHQELSQHFEKISSSESIKIEQSALNLIVREAEGSVRDGLSLLDQIFAYGDREILLDDVVQVLGLTDRNILLTLSESLLVGDKLVALTTLEKAFEYGIDLKRFLADMLECLRALLLLKIGEMSELIELPAEEIDLLRKITDKYSFETIHLKLNLLMQAADEIRFTTQPRLALETSLLKIIEAGNVVPVTSLLEKLNKITDHSPEQSGQSTTIDRPEKKKSEFINPYAQEIKESSPEKSDKQKFLKEETAVQEAEPVEPVKKPVEISPEVQEKATEPPIQNQAPDIEPIQEEEIPLPPPPPDLSENIDIHPHTHDVRRDWIKFTEYVKDRKIWMAQDLQRAESAKEVEGELHLTYDDPTTCTLLRNKENKKLLTEFVLDFFQKDLTVRFILPDETSNGTDNEDPSSPHKLRQKLSRDPLVQMAVEIFSGQVGDIRIGPRSR